MVKHRKSSALSTLWIRFEYLMSFTEHEIMAGPKISASKSSLWLLIHSRPWATSGAIRRSRLSCRPSLESSPSISASSLRDCASRGA